MTHKNIVKLSHELGQALEKINKSYEKYVTSIRVASQIAKELEEAAKEIVSQPHIEIKDFEIDN